MDEIAKVALVEDFCGVTGANQREARRYLNATDWQISAAVELFMSGNGETGGRESSSDREMSEVPRAPIPSRSGVLVDETFVASYAAVRRRATTNSVFDAFRNFQAEEVEVVSERAGTSRSEADRKRKTLENLFKPPFHLIHRGSFESAKLESARKVKWLLVNIQDVQEFDCQVLNRDVWNNAVVGELVKANFLFWQVTSDSAEGRQYQTYYNVRSWPHVAILDGRTGELLLNLTKFDRMSIVDTLSQFLERNPIGETVNGAAHSYANGTSAKRKIETLAASCDVTNDWKRSKHSTTNGIIDEPSIQSSSNGTSMPSLATFMGDSWPTEKKTVEDYQNFLGQTGFDLTVLLKLPDGTKQKLTLKSSSQLKAVQLYLDGLGYPKEKFELALNFPSRIFNSSNEHSTLEELSFNRQETIFVQEI